MLNLLRNFSTIYTKSYALFGAKNRRSMHGIDRGFPRRGGVKAAFIVASVRRAIGGRSDQRLAVLRLPVVDARRSRPVKHRFESFSEENTVSRGPIASSRVERGTVKGRDPQEISTSPYRI